MATPEGRAPVPAQLNSTGALAFWGVVMLTGAGAGIGAALLTRLLQWVQHLMWPGTDLLDAASQAGQIIAQVAHPSVRDGLREAGRELGFRL